MVKKEESTEDVREVSDRARLCGTLETNKGSILSMIGIYWKLFNKRGT